MIFFAKNLSVKVCVIYKAIDLSKRAESNGIGLDIEVSINLINMLNYDKTNFTYLNICVAI